MDYHKSWKKFIDNSNYLPKMIDFVNNTKNICPEDKNVFRFLNCDVSKTKYIILGMDPYPSTYTEDGKHFFPVATGRAFEVANVEYFTDKYKQVSLSNIFKALCYYKFKKKYSIVEIRNIFNKEKSKYSNTHFWFDEMERRGVIFLNSTLTTIIGESGAHIKVWTDFMNELISYIVSNCKCDWLIWGDKALDRINGLINKNFIIYSCHPASRVNNDFIENNCFIKANKIEWF